MALAFALWPMVGRSPMRIGNPLDAARAERGMVGVDAGSGIHRHCVIVGRTCYKIEWSPGPNEEEYEAMVALRRCGCPASALATPMTLYRGRGGRIIAAMPAYHVMGNQAGSRARHRLAHAVTFHNANGHSPVIIDMHGWNWMLDAFDNPRIIDLGFGIAGGWGGARAQSPTCATCGF